MPQVWFTVEVMLISACDEAVHTFRDCGRVGYTFGERSGSSGCIKSTSLVSTLELVLKIPEWLSVRAHQISKPFKLVSAGVSVVVSKFVLKDVRRTHFDCPWPRANR